MTRSMKANDPGARKDKAKPGKAKPSKGPKKGKGPDVVSTALGVREDEIRVFYGKKGRK